MVFADKKNIFINEIIVNNFNRLLSTNRCVRSKEIQEEGSLLKTQSAEARIVYEIYRMATFASIELSERAIEDEDDKNDEPSTSTVDKTLGIEKTGPRRLATNEISSIFNLKNELLKRKDNIKKTNLDYVRGKSSVLVTKKDEREAREKEASEREKRISANEKAWKKKEDEERFELAQQKMKDKAALYERLAEGHIVLENSDNTPVDFMVDFGSKKRQKDDEKRKRYEEQDDDNCGPSAPTRAPIPERYHHSEEQRVFGVSHMRLSTNEDKRKEEIKNLLELSKETNEQRKKEQIEQDEQEKKRREKVNALRKRKGLPPLKEPSPPPEVDIDSIPLPIVPETPEERHIRLMKSDREWDRGKGLYTQWIEKQRDERDDEFRPPDSYHK